jgi:hypothetical protein
MVDQYKNFRFESPNGDKYLVEHYPEVQGGYRYHPIFPGNQEYLPPRDVVKLTATSGKEPEVRNATHILRGVEINTVVGAAFHAVNNEVLGVQIAARLWPRDESKADQLYGSDVIYDGQKRRGPTPERPIPDEIKTALEAARNAWRCES